MARYTGREKRQKSIYRLAIVVLAIILCMILRLWVWRHFC